MSGYYNPMGRAGAPPPSALCWSQNKVRSHCFIAPTVDLLSYISQCPPMAIWHTSASFSRLRSLPIRLPATALTRPTTTLEPCRLRTKCRQGPARPPSSRPPTLWPPWRTRSRVWCVSKTLVFKCFFFKMSRSATSLASCRLGRGDMIPTFASSPFLIKRSCQ